MKESQSTRNVGDQERAVSAAVGGVLMAWGLRRRSLGGLLLAAAGAELIYRGVSGHCHVYDWLGKNTADSEPGRIKSAVTIDKPRDELFRLWREPDTLSRVMGDFADVESRGPNRMHWSLRAPAGHPVQWDAEIVEEREGELLRWRSDQDAPLPNEGEVRFEQAPGARGTEVRLTMRFDPPGGVLGDAAVAALGPTPNLLASHALRRFRRLAETGDVTLPHPNLATRADGMPAP